MTKSQAIAITGARGRLGSYFVKNLSKAGYQVFPYSRKADHEHYDLALLFRHCHEGRIDSILHFAWSVVPAEAEANPGKQWDTDLPFLEMLLNSLCQPGRKPARLIFFSTGAVYGESPATKLIFDEDHRPCPKGFYGRAKAEAEAMILAKMKFGFPAAILRATNIYGFSQAHPRPQGVISALFRAATTRKPFVLWGDGTAAKDYLFVEDFFRAVDSVLCHGLDGIFNVGSGECVSVRTLIEIIQNLTQANITIRPTPAAPWDVQQGKFAFSRIHQATGWLPCFSIHQGLARVWHDFGRMPGISPSEASV